MLRIQAEALTYDDVSLVPAHSIVLPKDVDLGTRLTRDLWYHDMGCSSWLLVTRNTVTHEILAVEAVADRKGGAA